MARKKTSRNRSGKVGRPKKPPGEALTETVRIRLKPEERRSVELKARAKGMNLSTWARWKLIYGK